MGRRLEHPKKVILSVRVSAEEAGELARQAKAGRENISDMLRRKIFGAEQ